MDSAIGGAPCFNALVTSSETTLWASFRTVRRQSRSHTDTAWRATPGAVARPNIVLIQTDDQTYRQLTRSAMPQTRRLLARRGTKFTDYVASTAQCCPSRASLTTGQ